MEVIFFEKMLRGKCNIFLLYAAIVVSLVACGKNDDDNPVPPPPPSENQFANPITSGSDPWVLKQDSFYYYMHTTGNRITLWRTTDISDVADASSVDIYRPTQANNHSQNIWAPEIHFLDGKWYVYYTAGAGPDSTQRLWVHENASADPFSGTWVDKGRIFNSDADFWAIDATVFEHNGTRYLFWSGRPNGSVQKQNIYISRMSDPVTLVPPTVMISEPEYPWEKNGEVNEAPQVIINNKGKPVLVYSASGCWTDEYCLGMLTLNEGGDPLKAGDWKKNSEPVFVKKPENLAYGPGHNSFFTSPDGTEDWIIYHANTNSGDGCGERRNIRMQRFTWNSDGTPAFGEPVVTGKMMEKPR